MRLASSGAWRSPAVSRAVGMSVGWRWLSVRMTGAWLLIATGAIHLDLYLTGYRTIPTIGWLFLLQVITAFGLGMTVLVLSSRAVAAAGAGFALSTLGGYLLSLRFGLLGFREVRTAAGVEAGVIEVAAFVALAAFVLRPTPSITPATSPTHTSAWYELRSAAIPVARLAAGGCFAIAGVLFGVALAATPTAAPRAGGSTIRLEVATLHGLPVLTNARGFTLYWFAPDTARRSTCYGTCAAYWPPVIGSATAAPGIAGMLGTFRRSDGVTQVTYNGHPLYTYVGDSAPGEANGNRINLNGGLWYETVVSR